MNAHNKTAVSFSEIEHRISLADYFAAPKHAAEISATHRARIIKNSLTIICAMAVLALVTFMLSILMYYGTAWRLTLKRLDVDIVQSDPGLSLGPPNASKTFSIGALLVQVLLNFSHPVLGHPIADFHVISSPGVERRDYLERRVRREELWAGIQIPANLTLDYYLAVTGQRKYYNTTLTSWLNDGRQSPTSTQLRGALTLPINGFSQNFAIAVAKGGVLGPLDLNKAVPNALVAPVVNAWVVLHQTVSGVNYFVATALVIGWSSMVPVAMGVFTNTQELYHTHAPWKVGVLRMLFFLVFTMLVAFTWAIILVCFGVDFATNFGALWAWYWLVLLTFASIVFFFISSLGPLGSVFLTPFMVLMITTSNAYLDSSTYLSDFYSWGEAFPWYWAYTGLRHNLFGTPDGTQLYPIAIGVTVTWFIVALFLDWLLYILRTAQRLRDLQTPDTALGKMLIGFSIGPATQIGNAFGAVAPRGGV